MAKCRIYETLNPVSEMHRDSNNGLMTLSGIFGVCGVRNNNNRIYEKSNYAAMVSEMQERIKRDGAIPGELEHPQTMNVNLENISHKITDINIDEDGVVRGTIQLLNTPKGQIAQAIIEGGLPLFVSSRAMGQVDKNGRVTLEKISVFDLVGSPGFSQAKMHLNESLENMTAYGDNIIVISEKEDENNNNNMEMSQELLERFEAMEARIQELETRNEELQDEIDEAKASNIDLQKLANGIQSWIVEEYSPAIQKWVTEHYQEHVMNEAKTWVVREVAPKIQQWVVEEFAPEVEKWVCEQYSPKVEQWVLEQVAPGIQSWMVEHFAPEIENWVTESYSPKVKEMIDENLTSNRDNKLKNITDIVSMLESIDVKKPNFGGRVITEGKQGADEPLYIANMPESARVKYNMASQEVKESIARRAKIFDFTNEGAIERFWEGINFEEIKPSTPMNEDLNNIPDLRERQIRMSLRRRRQML